jgi:hypothetical protein
MHIGLDYYSLQYIFAETYSHHAVMRKILCLLGTVLLICFASCDKKTIEDLQSRLDQLEKITLVSIQSQMASAQKSIASLEEAKRLLQEQIDALAAKGASMSDIVNALNTNCSCYFSEYLACILTVELHGNRQEHST